MIDIRLMQAAVAVAEELSFSGAAAKLGTTQPAVTKQIQDLEERVGRELFHRNKRKVEVTEAGQAFVEDARKALLFTERAVLSARGRSDSAEALLRLGRTPYTDPFLISTALSIRLPLYPALKLSLTSNFSPALTHHLLTGCLDLAFVSGITAPVGVSSTEIANAPLYVAFSEDDSLISCRFVKLSDLHDRRWIMFERHINPVVYDKLERAALADSAVPSNIQYISSAEEAIPLLHESRGIAFLTRAGAWRIARDGVTMRPLSDDRIQLKTFVAVRPEDDSRLLSEFVRTLVRKLKMVGQPLVQEQLPLAI